VFEGPDGVGKTTIISRIAEALRQEGLKVHVTSEPSSSQIGELIRGWLLRQQVEPPHVYALLFTADRYLHVYSEVMPMLRQGYVVLQERYKESTIVYQSAMGLETSWLETLNKYLPDPDLTIVLDLEVDKLVERVSSRRKDIEIFESRTFLEKVRSLYLQRARERGYLVIYTGDLDRAYRQVLQYVRALLERKGLLK